MRITFSPCHPGSERVMSGEPGSLLIVDDEELNREGLARRLQRRGFAVSCARGGREAIELLGRGRFDLVLLDVVMPGMNGLEVLKFLRRVDSLIDLPVIMVTARGESGDVVEALELGANAYLTKPLDFPVVLARIRTQLSLKRAVGQVTDLERKLDARNRELEAVAARLATANDRANRDLEEAARIQKAFLPELPAEVPGARFAGAFEPCSHLTGGYLNVFRLDDRRLGLCVLDVNGKGVAAALLSVTASHLLAHTAKGPGAAVVPPGEVVGRLSKRFSEESTAGRVCTLLYGVLDLDTGEFRFVSAGRPGPVHLPRDSAAASPADRDLPLGVGDGEYRERTIALRPGDRLVLHSDGLTAVRNPEGEHFGKHRLVSALERTRPDSLADSLAGLLGDVGTWRGVSPRPDDLSILMVERTVVQGPTRAGSPEATR
jgi:sigma-B regulation protein RsbU (phosphoserine phosphatase)